MTMSSIQSIWLCALRLSHAQHSRMVAEPEDWSSMLQSEGGVPVVGADSLEALMAAGVLDANGAMRQPPAFQGLPGLEQTVGGEVPMQQPFYDQYAYQQQMQPPPYAYQDPILQNMQMLPNQYLPPERNPYLVQVAKAPQAPEPQKPNVNMQQNVVPSITATTDSGKQVTVKQTIQSTTTPDAPAPAAPVAQAPVQPAAAPQPPAQVIAQPQQQIPAPPSSAKMAVVQPVTTPNSIDHQINIKHDNGPSNPFVTEVKTPAKIEKQTTNEDGSKSDTTQVTHEINVINVAPDTPPESKPEQKIATESPPESKPEEKIAVDTPPESKPEDKTTAPETKTDGKEDVPQKVNDLFNQLTETKKQLETLADAIIANKGAALLQTNQSSSQASQDKPTLIDPSTSDEDLEKILTQFSATQEQRDQIKKLRGQLSELDGQLNKLKDEHKDNEDVMKMFTSQNQATPENKETTPEKKDPPKESNGDDLSKVVQEIKSKAEADSNGIADLMKVVMELKSRAEADEQTQSKKKHVVQDFDSGSDDSRDGSSESDDQPPPKPKKNKHASKRKHHDSEDEEEENDSPPAKHSKAKHKKHKKTDDDDDEEPKQKPKKKSKKYEDSDEVEDEDDSSDEPRKKEKSMREQVRDLKSEMKNQIMSGLRDMMLPKSTPDKYQPSDSDEQDDSSSSPAVTPDVSDDSTEYVSSESSSQEKPSTPTPPKDAEPDDVKSSEAPPPEPSKPQPPPPPKEQPPPPPPEKPPPPPKDPVVVLSQVQEVLDQLLDNQAKLQNIAESILKNPATVLLQTNQTTNQTANQTPSNTAADKAIILNPSTPDDKLEEVLTRYSATQDQRDEVKKLRSERKEELEWLEKLKNDNKDDDEVQALIVTRSTQEVDENHKIRVVIKPKEIEEKAEPNIADVAKEDEDASKKQPPPPSENPAPASTPETPAPVPPQTPPTPPAPQPSPPDTAAGDAVRRMLLKESLKLSPEQQRLDPYGFGRMYGHQPANGPPTEQDIRNKQNSWHLDPLKSLSPVRPDTPDIFRNGVLHTPETPHAPFTPQRTEMAQTLSQIQQNAQQSIQAPQPQPPAPVPQQTPPQPASEKEVILNDLKNIIREAKGESDREKEMKDVLQLIKGEANKEKPEPPKTSEELERELEETKIKEKEEERRFLFQQIKTMQDSARKLKAGGVPISSDLETAITTLSIQPKEEEDAGLPHVKVFEITSAFLQKDENSRVKLVDVLKGIGGYVSHGSSALQGGLSAQPTVEVAKAWIHVLSHHDSALNTDAERTKLSPLLYKLNALIKPCVPKEALKHPHHYAAMTCDTNQIKANLQEICQAFPDFCTDSMKKDNSDSDQGSSDTSEDEQPRADKSAPLKNIGNGAAAIQVTNADAIVAQPHPHQPDDPPTSVNLELAAIDTGDSEADTPAEHPTVVEDSAVLQVDQTPHPPPPLEETFSPLVPFAPIDVGGTTVQAQPNQQFPVPQTIVENVAAIQVQQPKSLLPADGSFFARQFGFAEPQNNRHQEMREIFKYTSDHRNPSAQLTIQGLSYNNGKEDRFDAVGPFATPSLGTLLGEIAKRNEIMNFQVSEGMKLEMIPSADLATLYSDPANSRAVFQAPCQLNGLPVPVAETDPSDQLTNLNSINSQAAVSAKMCPAALVYRKDFVDGEGQCKHNNQLNLGNDALSMIRSSMAGNLPAGAADEFLKVQNGHLLDVGGKYHDLLSSAIDANQQSIEGATKVGLHWDTAVARDAQHTVTQVLTAGVSTHGNAAHEKLSQQFVAAGYHATLAVGVIKAMENLYMITDPKLKQFINTLLEIKSELSKQETLTQQALESPTTDVSALETSLTELQSKFINIENQQLSNEVAIKWAQRQASLVEQQSILQQQSAQHATWAKTEEAKLIREMQGEWPKCVDIISKHKKVLIEQLQLLTNMKKSNTDLVSLAEESNVLSDQIQNALTNRHKHIMNVLEEKIKEAQKLLADMDNGSVEGLQRQKVYLTVYGGAADDTSMETKALALKAVLPTYKPYPLDVKILFPGQVPPAFSSQSLLEQSTVSIEAQPTHLRVRDGHLQ